MMHNSTKKLMRLWCVVLLAMVISLYGMDSSVNRSCFFALLPVELCNKIASYIGFCETDAEFIARTQKEEVVPEIYEKKLEQYFLLQDDSIKTPPSHNDGSKVSKKCHLISAYSTDRTKILGVKIVYEPNNRYGRMAIYDVKTDSYRCDDDINASLTLLFNEPAFSGTMYIWCVALSHNQRRVTLLAHKKLTTYVYATRRSECPTEIFIPAWYGDFSSIGFNKQQSKIIIHTNKDSAASEGTTSPCYCIRLLTRDQEHERRTTLNAYLTARVICKPLQH